MSVAIEIKNNIILVNVTYLQSKQKKKSAELHELLKPEAKSLINYHIAFKPVKNDNNLKLFAEYVKELNDERFNELIGIKSLDEDYKPTKAAKTPATTSPAKTRGKAAEEAAKAVDSPIAKSRGRPKKVVESEVKSADSPTAKPRGRPKKVVEGGNEEETEIIEI